MSDHVLSDGMLEFDLCNFFPTIPEEQRQGHESDLTEEHNVRFNLGSFLIRSQDVRSSSTRASAPSRRRPRRPLGPAHA